MKLISLLCIGALLFFSGCGVSLPSVAGVSNEESSSASSVSSSSTQPPEPSQPPESSSLPDSTSAGEVLIEWDSVYASQSIITNKGASWYLWENTIEDQETIRELWEITQKAKAGEPCKDQVAPAGGYPFQVAFRSKTETVDCSFFWSRVAIDGVWYDLAKEEDFDRVVELADGLGDEEREQARLQK